MDEIYNQIHYFDLELQKLPSLRKLRRSIMFVDYYTRELPHFLSFVSCWILHLHHKDHDNPRYVLPSQICPHDIFVVCLVHHSTI